MKMDAATAVARTMAMAPMAFVMIALATIDIALFVTCHLVAFAIACVVAAVMAFFVRQQREQW